MSQVINTNIMSLNAQRNLSGTSTELATALERLSSGLRINSAKDDAAGLAITERFTTQIRGLNQAVRNSNDGISLAQTGEGALAEMTNNLQRIRELAVQSANATNSDSDRSALDQEVQQRLAEIDRIALQTSFNGRKILDGSFGSALFQVGANVGETINIELETSMRQSSIGAITTATTNPLNSLIVESEDNSTGMAGQWTDAVASADGQNYSISVGGVELVNLTRNTGETITAADVQNQILTNTATLRDAGFTITGTVQGQNLAITREDGAAFDVTVGNTMGGTAGGFVGADFATGTNAINNGVEGVPLVLTGLALQIGEGAEVMVANGSYTKMDDLVNAINAALGSNATASYDEETTQISIISGQDIKILTDNEDIFTDDLYEVDGSLATVDILDVASANDAISRVDSALTSVSNLRSTFGAVQNRFESTIANLSTTVENLSASRSRIQDADFAAETANLTRAQILQQAGVAMLAQANQMPQNVLQLLQ